MIARGLNLSQGGIGPLGMRDTRAVEWSGAQAVFVALLVLYGLYALVAVTTALFTRRPKEDSEEPLAALIPARDEEENLKRLVPALTGQGARVYVFDDESSDQTAQAAREAGALVISGGPLPEGWTGKNRACHALARAASEDAPGEWLTFMDADTYPDSTFAAKYAQLLAQEGRRSSVVTGFPRLIPGKGIEPLYLSWMTWILLATDPFGLVAATGKGHNRFTNGQITSFKGSAYWEIDPHEKVKGKILEDVQIGRLLAREKVAVSVVNLSGILAVKMYENVGQAWRGMSKNCYEITGSAAGTTALAALLALSAWGWVFAGSGWWIAYLVLAGSKLVTDRFVRHPIWLWPLAPITLTLGAATLLNSIRQRRAGVEWKGRRYPANPS